MPAPPPVVGRLRTEEARGRRVGRYAGAADGATHEAVSSNVDATARAARRGGRIDARGPRVVMCRTLRVGGNPRHMTELGTPVGISAVRSVRDRGTLARVVAAAATRHSHSVVTRRHHEDHGTGGRPLQVLLEPRGGLRQVLAAEPDPEVIAGMIELRAGQEEHARPRPGPRRSRRSGPSRGGAGTRSSRRAAGPRRSGRHGGGRDRRGRRDCRRRSGATGPGHGRGRAGR